MKRNTKLALTGLLLVLFSVGVAAPFMMDKPDPEPTFQAYVWIKDSASNSSLSGVVVRVRQMFPPYNETEMRQTTGQGVVLIEDYSVKEYALLVKKAGYLSASIAVNTTYPFTDYVLYMKRSNSTS